MNTLLIIAIIVVLALMVNERYKFLRFELVKIKNLVVEIIPPEATIKMDFENVSNILSKSYDPLSLGEKKIIEEFILQATHNHLKTSLPDNPPNNLRAVISYCYERAGEDYTKYMIANLNHLITVAKENNIDLERALRMAIDA